MTVEELIEKLQELIKQGHGDKIVTVDNEAECGEGLKEVYIFKNEAVMSF